MYTYLTEEAEQTIETLESLANSIISLENTGDLSAEDADECLYYLQKVASLTGSDVDFDSLSDET